MWINEDKIKVKPNLNSLNPELIFEIVLNITKAYEIPLEVSGFLFSADKKKVANVIGFTLGQNKVLELGARDSDSDNTEPVVVQMFAPLDHKVIDYLHTLREVTPKGDVILNLEVNIKSLESHTILSHMSLMERGELPNNFPEKYQKEDNPARLVYYSYQRQFSSDQRNMWILSGSNGPTFLILRNYVFPVNITIPSADWLHDFCPIFELGKFSVVEFRMPEYTEGSESIGERLNESIKAIKKMETNLVKGEWNQVIEDSRAVSELLRDQNEIQELLQRDGYTPEAFSNLNACLRQLFDFSAKFHHKLDPTKKKILPDIKASKEDAYLIYTISIALINLISKKIQRLT